MDCLNCKIPMEKEYFHANARDNVSLVIIWRCEECGYRDRNQQNIP